MQMIPADIWEQYVAVLKKRAVPVSHQADYRKWLRQQEEKRMERNKGAEGVSLIIKVPNGVG